jgi:hypothetical protein
MIMRCPAPTGTELKAEGVTVCSEATQEVQLLVTVARGAFARVHLKDKHAVDKLVAALQAHKNEVWPPGKLSPQEEEELRARHRAALEELAGTHPDDPSIQRKRGTLGALVRAAKSRGLDLTRATGEHRT